MGNISELSISAGYLASTGRKYISKVQEELLMWHAIFGYYDKANAQKVISASGVETKPIMCLTEQGVKSTCGMPQREKKRNLRS